MKAIEGPEWTIKGKYPSKLESLPPGPGQYKTPETRSTIAYTMQMRPGSQSYR